MAHAVLKFEKSDPVAVKWPTRGATHFLRLILSSRGDEVWINRERAEDLYKALGEALAQGPAAASKPSE